MGIIPKSHQPGKFRLVVDLLAPLNRSVNDRIDSGLCSLSYASIDDAVRLVCEARQDAFMAKLDLEAAYWHMPVHPDDQGLLAIKWGDKVYVNSGLPFGLPSAPKIFTAVADGIAWCMSCSGIKDFIHYLDDFFLLDPLVPQIARGLWKWLSPCVSCWASQWLPTKWRVCQPLSPFWESRWTHAGLS